ncbi:MAG: gliding motility protein GldM [Cytophagales bacterium]|nr:gliding motility protein GldM [Cytophaga sp.]
MSGGKETPRQKMIGMMYLVLTALLALQVSSAIIQKFQFLDDSLQQAVEVSNKANGETQAKIAKSVKDSPKDQFVLDRAEQVRAETSKLIGYIHSLRTSMIDTTGGRDKDDNSYIGAKEEELIAGMMVGTEGTKTAKGYILQTKLNDYVANVSKIVGNDPESNKPSVPVRKIAMDGKEDPMFMGDKEKKNENFAQLSFDHTPMVAALAVLSTKEADVRKIETEALEALARLVGAAQIKFDNVFAVAVANSSVVAAGTDYQAELFIAASSSTSNPTMTRNGSAIPVEGGRGKVKFKASANSYDSEGNSKQTWKGAITIKNKSKDTTFTLDVPYVVARPVIQIQSASVNALYLRCGNELNVQVPALGATYAPTFTASGASITKLPQKGFIVVIPNNPTGVKLNVASNGTAIGSQDFKVRGIPKPTIQVLSGGKEVDQKNGVAAPGPRSLQVKAKSDESFAQFLPKDARYAVTRWNVMLARGKRPVTQQNFATEMANLSSFAAQAQANDRLIIEVQEVYRTNFLGEKEKVNIGTPIFTVPIQ